MHKLIHLILVVILTVLFIIPITSGIFDTSLNLGFTLFYGAVLGGVILISSIESYPDFVLTAGTTQIEFLGWVP